jgi:hypothetical protein
MTAIRRVETYLSPRNAERITRVSRAKLAWYVRRGDLTQYRTAGGHSRYALSELRSLRAALRRQDVSTGGGGRAKPPIHPSR